MSAVPPYSAARVEVLRLPAGAAEPDELAVEEPLEIRIGGRPIAVTMRTPGHDEELALGFLLSEGIRPTAARPPTDLAANTIDVDADGFDAERLARNFYTTSSCGVCGKGALEAVAVDAPRVESDLRVPLSLVAKLPERLRAGQPTFAATGGLHATGLFDAAGDLVSVREDVGRHNAMDKVVGWALREGIVLDAIRFRHHLQGAAPQPPSLEVLGKLWRRRDVLDLHPSTVAEECLRAVGEHAAQRGQRDVMPPGERARGVGIVDEQPRAEGTEQRRHRLPDAAEAHDADRAAAQRFVPRATSVRRRSAWRCASRLRAAWRRNATASSAT